MVLYQYLIKIYQFDKYSIFNHHSFIRFFKPSFNESIIQFQYKSNISTSQLFPSYISLQLFNNTPPLYQKSYKYFEGYTVTLRTKEINNEIVQSSIINATHFRRHESYIVKYVNHTEQPVIDYDSNPCKSFSFPYCILQNYDDSDHYSFSYSLFYQSNYVIYIDIDELDVPLNYINTTMIDIALYYLHHNKSDVFTCTTYNDRLLNGCLITKQSLIRDIITKSTITKGKLDLLDYLPIYFKQLNQKLRVTSMTIKDSFSPYLNVKDKLIPSLFGCKDLIENDTSFTVAITSWRRPKLKSVFDSFDRQITKPKQVVMIQNNDILHWRPSLFANRTTTYYHIWCSNWNSKYVGKYHPGMMYDTTFVYVIDDDFFISQNSGFSTVMNTIRKDNMIYGLMCYTFTYPEWKNPHPSNYCDVVTNMLFVRVKHFKIMFRVKLVTYARSEDTQLSVINNIQCHIHSRKLSISTSTSTQDKYRRDNRKYAFMYGMNKPSFNNIDYPLRKSENNGKKISYYGVQEWFNKGYVPVQYENITALI